MRQLVPMKPESTEPNNHTANGKGTGESFNATAICACEPTSTALLIISGKGLPLDPGTAAHTDETKQRGTKQPEGGRDRHW